MKSSRTSWARYPAAMGVSRKVPRDWVLIAMGAGTNLSEPQVGISLVVTNYAID